MTNLTSPVTVLTVSPEGTPKSSFSSVKDALDTANLLATVSDRYVVYASAGIYTEDPMTVESYVTLKGDGEAATLLEPNTDTSALLTLTGSAYAQDVRVQNVSGVGGIGIDVSGTGSISVLIRNITVLDCETCYNVDGTGTTNCTVTAQNCAAVNGFGAATVVDGWLVQANGEVIGTNISSVATNSAFKMTRGIRAAGAGTNVLIKACDFTNCTTGVIADTGARVGGAALTCQGCNTSYQALDGGNTVMSIGSSASLNAVNWDAQITGANTTFWATACLLRDDLIDRDITAENVIITATSPVEGDEGFIVKGELLVGDPTEGKESAFGEGDSYTRGMMVYTEDTGNNFVDVSDEAKSPSGSTFTFPGTAANNAIYVSTDIQNAADYRTFGGIKMTITAAAVYGAGTIVAEYWDGAAWTAFNTMTTDSGQPYARQTTMFGTTGSYQMRFNPLILADWDKNDPVSSGTNRYWMRFRIDSTVTTAPTFEQFKIHSNRTEINAEGWSEFFGTARPVNVLPLDSGTWQAANSSPGNADVYATAELAVGRIENDFQSSANDRTGFVTALPSDLDTSAPVSLRLHFTVDSGATGDVKWIVTYGTSIDGDVVADGTPGSPSVTELSTSAVTTVPGTENDQQFTSIVQLDVSSFAPAADNNPLLWVAVRRDTGEAEDTKLGNAAMIQVTPYYLSWSNGGFIGQAF